MAPYRSDGDENQGRRPHRRVAFGIALSVGLAIALQAVAAIWPFGPVPRTGPAQYQAHCGGCHALDRNKFGPMHRNLIGRAAATQPGYRYSAALQRSGIVWTESALDAWITDPGRMVRGTRMGARLGDTEARRLIIDYLKTMTASDSFR